MTVGAFLLAVLTLQIDQSLDVPHTGRWNWIFSGTPEGARAVLSSIASGIITVTGVIFSVTIVALQLASTQFTPRILRNFMADRGNQLVLGVFIGTFTYTLLILRMVRGETDDVDSLVPNISVTLAAALALASIGFLIFFIDHAARSLQASVIIDRVTRETLRVLDATLPEQVGAPARDNVVHETPEAQATVIAARRSGYIQGIEQDRLMEVLETGAYTVRLERKVGDFVFPGSPLATVWPAGLQRDGALAGTIRRAFLLGPVRTPHLDPELGIIELADIAVKALSPGINDPTTAVLCLDRLAEVLVAYGRREPPARVRTSRSGNGTLILLASDFERVVELALDQIRHFGIENAHFTMNLLERLREMAAVLPPHRHPPLARQAAAALREARLEIREPADLARVERAAEATLHQLQPVARDG